MKYLSLAFAVLAACFACSAQTTTPPDVSQLGFSSFSVTSSALAVHGNGTTIALADMGEAAAVTTHLSIRLDELMAASQVNFSGYYGGAKYTFPTPAFLTNTNLAPLQFQASIEGGVTRSTNSLGTPINKPSGRALFDANWNPTATGAVSFNIFEVGYGYIPQLVSGHNHFMTASLGVKISF